MRTSGYLVAGALASAVSAQNYLGFSTGSTKIDGSVKVQADYEAEFKAAQNLVGAPGVFNAARLYTNIQGGSATDPIEAFPAAIATNTSLLLGIWCSGTTTIKPELTALQAGLTKYGNKLADLIIGISIGSEDLYRNSVTGVENKAGVGADPSVIVGFINDYRKAFANTALKNVPVGHVDTWNVFPNATNKAVIDAVDWIGLDEYPYYQTGQDNTIDNAANLFKAAFDASKAAVGDKPLWVTETGWPYTGMTWDKGVPSVANAKAYWDAVGCDLLFNKVPTFWYDLVDDNAGNNESFAITDNLSTKARFNLTCPPPSTSASSSGAAASSTPTKTGSGSGSGSTKTTGTALTTASGSKTTSSGAASASPSGTTVSKNGASVLNLSIGTIVGVVAFACML
ncbi:GPI-anchored cell wall beta-1,3-endoglucanase EglC [Sporothrix schenckii 1099-18]|uniref:GPI-anchored cell wall beta-1,3-endoglucanase EglC n=1 Tax=Sporothrix schenckii 1099-18 TaxID=1397361 RepID=A0A0F2MJM9_SPOSC|nr:GPI-anchored cell wall beta-1,3-endoglucanase EglC [Sporothrix schenckii 1099-18]KJR89269.1 GPI-anchored cell wall beta-1,3-endoglucanase EglC [Sporothrix schenckii 1099-18]